MKYIVILLLVFPVVAMGEIFVPENHHAPNYLEKNAATIKSAHWRILPGVTLKSGLESWSAQERCAAPGVHYWGVMWLTSVNYRVDAPLMFQGDFKQALTSLFDLYSKAQVPLYVTIHRNQCLITVDSKRN